MDEKKDFLLYLNACRVCLRTDDLESIFTVEEDVHYAQKIMTCSTVEISPQENLPLNICKICISNLNTSYYFKKQCEDTDKYLRSFNIEKEQDNNISKDNNNCDNIQVKIEKVVGDDDKTFIDDVFSDASDDEKLINVFTKCLAEKTKLNEKSGRKKSSHSGYVLVQVTDASKGCDGTRNINPDECKDNTEDEKLTVKKQRRKTLQSSEFCCQYCPKTFLNNSQLTVHLRYHTGERPFTCKDCPKTFYIKADLQRHTSCKHDKHKPHHCLVCGKCFGLKSGLVVHMRTHTGEKPYKCSECDSSFTQSGSLREHKRTHTGEQPLVCVEPQCGRGFASHSALARHRRTHSGERRGQCTICGKKFFSSNYLQHHMKIHTGEKPCVCKICGKAFTMPPALLKHMTTHDPHTKTVCTQCGLAVSNIVIHMRTHSNEKRYKCTYCDKRFRQLTGLNYHLTVHTNERKYACTFCEKKFRSQQTLKNHKSIHSSERPFKCEICQLAFRNLSYKNRHNRIYHSSSETNKRAIKKNKKVSNANKLSEDSIGNIKNDENHESLNGDNW